MVRELTGLEVELTYSRGWVQELTLAEALQASQGRDRIRGLTHPGPHRADVVVRLKNVPAREVLSRGQQKLVAAAMALSQLGLLQSRSETTPTLLLDDPAAELDGERLGRFLEQVSRLRCQLVFTSLRADDGSLGMPDRVFHVEQGTVRAM
jgi:DNA replication and repair protein RecF